MEDTETILGWMKSTESRFLKERKEREQGKKNLNATASGALSESAPMKIENSSKILSENPQKSLDHFINSGRSPYILENTRDGEEDLENSGNSPLFDEHFSLSDFRNLTQQWKKEHKIAS